jgi:ornithine carbamoyltransferase
VAHSLLIGGAMMGMKVRIATPPAYQPDPAIVARARQLAAPGAEIILTEDPQAAAQGSQVLYTDVWASMGQENLADERIPIFQPYQINQSLLNLAAPEAIVLHCLPAHRGEEITAEVMEGPQSRLWQQAENRMHAQKALLVSLLGVS